MLRILLFEIRKLLEQPIILLFFIACLMLNTIYIATAGLDQSYLNYVQDTETKTGSFITSEFHEKLSNMSSSNQHQRLLTETDERENIFNQYSTEALGQEMIDYFQIQGSMAEKMKIKYEKLTPIVHELAEEKAALEVGAAGETMSFFSFLRNRLFHAILGESLIFALLLGLYGSTSERLTKTDVLMITSKTGRKTQVTKYVASLMIALLFYVTMVTLSFAIFNQMHSIGTLWNTSISTQFHVNVYVLQSLEIPFIPWRSMTLLHYTLLSIVLGCLLVFICHGFNFLIGLWTDHLFRGFVLFVVFYVSLLGIEQIVNHLNWWDMRSLLMWHPISLWNLQAYWFTEMGPFSTIPWQETIAMAVNIIFLVIVGMITATVYSTKEVK